MQLRLEVFGDVQLSRDLTRWANAAEDMSPAFSDIYDDFRKIERRQFDSEGSYASGGWAALRPSTVAARHGSAHPILRAVGPDGGRLRRSLTTKGARDAIGRITADEMVVGTKTPYAKFHQRGTKHMGRRRPVELTDADRKRFVKIIQAHLVATDRAQARQAGAA